MVGYKDHALAKDPFYLTGCPDLLHLVTVRWRDNPVNLPEDALMGVTDYTNPVRYDIVVDDDSNCIYANTGLSHGDHLEGLLG